MFQAELAALGAALCWTFGGAISLAPARALGALGFGRIRMAMVLVMLATVVAAGGGWRSLSAEYLSALVLSGLIGIWIGDTALFSTLRRLGPRRMAVLYSTSAPMSALLAFLFLGERLAPAEIGGCALVIAGVVLAIVFARAGGAVHQWEAIQGPVVAGVAIGLLAALCQAAGAIIAKPALEAGVDPFAASAVRVGAAALLLWSPLPLYRTTMPTLPLTPRLAARIALSGLLGMAVGMTLLLYALGRGEVGIVMTLSATVPVLVLPLIWVRTRQRPAAAAWAGAVLVVAGTAMILNA